MAETSDASKSKETSTGRTILGVVALVVVLVGLAISVSFSKQWQEKHRRPSTRPSPEQIAKSMQRNRSRKPVKETDLIGSSRSRFQDRPEPPALLVGMTVTYDWINRGYRLFSVTPIYLTDEGRAESQRYGLVMIERIRVEAREGYAVGGLVGSARYSLDGFRLVFMRIDGDSLDPDDRYESRWIGIRGKGEETEIGCDGRKVVGLKGVAGHGLTTIGLIFDDESLPPEATSAVDHRLSLPVR